MVVPLETAEEGQVEEDETYDLHMRVPRAMQEKLKKLAELASKPGLVSQPTLVELMNLCISWGMSIMKNRRAKRMGY